MKRAGTWAVGAVLAAMLAGCAGYKLGPTNGFAPGARTVEIATPVNQTIEPRLEDYLMNSLRKNVQRDGTYRVDTHNESDVILNVVITAYDRSAVSFQPADVLTVRDYQITMTARVSAKERLTGKVLFDKPVTGRTTLLVSTDLTSAERQAIPEMTDDLARKAVAYLADGTW